MKKYAQLTVLAGVSFLSACAQPPAAIAPMHVSDVPYQGWSCEQLASEQVQLNMALTTASAQQEQARSNDVAGIIFVGLPLGSMSGLNVAPMIAQYKGERLAVSRTLARKGCLTH